MDLVRRRWLLITIGPPDRRRRPMGVSGGGLLKAKSRKLVKSDRNLLQRQQEDLAGSGGYYGQGHGGPRNKAKKRTLRLCAALSV